MSGESSHVKASHLDQSFAQAAAHDAVCVVYESESEYSALLASLINTRLSKNERCLYLGKAGKAAQISALLCESGFDASAALASGALVVLPENEAAGFGSSPSSYISFCRAACQAAAAAGFAGLCLINDAHWVRSRAVHTDCLTNYKLELDSLLTSHDLAMFSLYDQRAAPEEILFAIRTHPLIIYRQMLCPNYFYLPPELGRHEDNKEVRVRRLLDNILDRREAEAALRYRLNFEELITKISTIFVNLPSAQLGPAIDDALCDVGEFVKADRVYLFRVQQEERRLLHAHEWCAPGIAPRMPALPQISFDAIPFFLANYLSGQSMFVPRLDELAPSVDAEKAAAYLEGVTSIFIVPLQCAGGVIGLLGIHTIGRELEWSPDTDTLLRNVAEVFANALSRKSAEEQHALLEAQILQSQKLESLGVMAGGIAHDFNNLLTAILGNAGLALMHCRGESQHKVFLERISDAARRAADLCERMLAYAGKARFSLEVLDVSALIEEMGQLLQVCVPKKAILQYNLTPGVAGIEADAAQIRQVVMNLVTNAADALSGEDGVISVATGKQFCTPADFAGAYVREDSAAGDYVYLEVADTGCGMDDGTAAHIFDPFYTTKFSGRGLGLAVVLGIVRSHHGVILVKTEKGAGTSFRIYFPASGKPPARQITASSASAAWKGQGTILVVDDEEIVRNIAASMLETFGFCVLTAGDGNEAIELFDQHGASIKLVLLDLTMPKLDGHETLRLLRQRSSDIPVLLSSGYTEDNSVEHAAADGKTGFIHKPYAPAELAAKLQQLLPENG